MTPQGSGAARAHDAAEVAAALERVFERPELRPDESGWFDRAFARLLEVLGGLDPDPEAAWTLLWIAVGAVVLLGTWIASRFLAGAARRRQVESVASPALRAPVDLEARLAEWRARAAAARTAGDLTLALRLEFFALLLALSRRGDLELRDAWTPREMLERGRPSATARAALEPWLSELDARLFGTRGVSPDALRRFDELRETLLARGGGGAA